MDLPQSGENGKNFAEVVSKVSIGEQKQTIPTPFGFVQPEIDRHLAMTFQGDPKRVKVDHKLFSRYFRIVDNAEYALAIA